MKNEDTLRFVQALTLKHRDIMPVEFTKLKLHAEKDVLTVQMHKYIYKSIYIWVAIFCGSFLMWEADEHALSPNRVKVISYAYKPEKGLCTTISTH